MKTRSSILTAVASLCLSGMAASSASPSVAGAETVSGVAQVAPRRVLVLAVLGSPTSRRAVEDAVVGQLGQAGISAVAGYTVSPDTSDLSKQLLTQALAACGAEAALVCRWSVVRQTTYARHGSSSATPTPGRVRQQAFGNAKLVDAATLETLWSTATKSDQAGGFREAAPDFAKTLVGAIRSDGAMYCGSKAKKVSKGDSNLVVRY
jgi:hypothetical protein